MKQSQSVGNWEGLQGVGLTTRPTSKSTKSPESITVEDLTKAFKKLSVNLLQQMQ